MSVGNFLTLESATIPVLQVKGLSGRSQPQGQQHSVVLAALEISKVGLSHLNCWMCSHCFECSFEKKLLRKGAYTSARYIQILQFSISSTYFFMTGKFSDGEET